MGAIAAILIAGAIVAFIVGGYLKLKGGRITKTPFVPTGRASDPSAASPKGAVSAQGAVRCDQPLVSPVTQTPCLYYKVEVIGSWKEGDSNKSKTYAEERNAAAFALDDGSGPVHVDASHGNLEDTVKSFDETKKEGMFADLKSIVGKSEPIMFGSYAFENPPMSKANSFRCTETIVPVTDSAYVLGKLEEGRITSPGLFSMILSGKGRDEILGASAKNAKMAFIGGAAAGALGAITGVVSAVIG